MLSRTIVHLTRPRITRAFNVQVVEKHTTSAELSGIDIPGVAMLLSVASGAPRFDIEFDGQIFWRCTLSSTRREDTIPFAYEVASRIVG